MLLREGFELFLFFFVLLGILFLVFICIFIFIKYLELCNVLIVGLLFKNLIIVLLMIEG